MEWMKYIYEKFFMRDFLGKLLPGSIELYALVHLAGVNNKIDLIGWPWPMWVLAGAASLVTALAFQTFAEWIGIHSPSPRPRRILFFPGPHNWKEVNTDFRKRSSIITQATEAEWNPKSSSQRERYVFLKEGSGNLGTAILLIIPVLNLRNHWVGSGLLVAFSIMLLATHFVHAKRQAEHEIHSLLVTAVGPIRSELECMAGRLGIGK